MVEPLSAAGPSAAKALTSLLTKRLQSRVGVRLGSRDERRQVYARFQGAVTDMVTLSLWVQLDMRLHVIWLGRHLPVTLRPRATYAAAREALQLLRQAKAELIQATLDLRLVANPEPLRAADAVVERLEELEALHVSVKHVEYARVANRVFEAQREFTDVCRDDLWYLPKWWQVYRLEWWRGQRWRRRRPA